jgi:hypothetical protein
MARGEEGGEKVTGRKEVIDEGLRFLLDSKENIKV